MQSVYPRDKTLVPAAQGPYFELLYYMALLGDIRWGRHTPRYKALGSLEVERTLLQCCFPRQRSNLTTVGAPNGADAYP